MEEEVDYECDDVGSFPSAEEAGGEVSPEFETHQMPQQGLKATGIGGGNSSSNTTTA